MDAGASKQIDTMVESLLARATSGQSRVVDALLASVTHIHSVLKEMRPTPNEWRSVIDFLTDVGHSSNARRQEWVLLSDVIGASTLVEEMNSVRPDGATPNTLPGPFYRADVPERENGSDLSRDGIGLPLLVAGTITGLDGNPVLKAVVEVWHANSLGVYENQQPDLQPEFNLRGRMLADANGRFSFSTVCPKGYSLPEDGPVGHFLNGLGIKLERPAHLHFRVSAPDFQVLTTHVYDKTDPAIGRDALFCVKAALLGDFRPITRPEGPAKALDVSFVLARLDETTRPQSHQST